VLDAAEQELDDVVPALRRAQRHLGPRERGARLLVGGIATPDLEPGRDFVVGRTRVRRDRLPGVGERA
jgi:hypothetical protein